MYSPSFKPTPSKLPGFTLVELIVVITIFSILGTIGFISIQGYSSSARDSSRISNLVNLQKGLTLFNVAGGSYPMPESPITITASGTTIGYQGFARDQIANIAKLSAGATKDPLDPTIYTTYATNSIQTKMQLMGFLEDGSKVTALLETTAQAATNTNYVTRSPSTKGDTLGILIGSTGSALNQPVQELYDVTSFTGVDIFTQVFTGASNYVMAGKTSATVSASPDSCNAWIKNYPSLLGMNGTYQIKPNNSNITLNVYCDMTTEGGGWTVFQRRYNGSVDFYRTWSDYKVLFGSVTGEYWLGNDNLNILTNINREIYIDLVANDNTTAYAKYSAFQVSNEANKYQLTVKGYSGTAGDSLGEHNGFIFSRI